MDAAAAREYFPRGLKQPESGFRFSMDALLLASFAGPGGAKAAIDLGTGSGVVGLGLLLRTDKSQLTVTGVDVNPEMIACASSNAEVLGFSGRFNVVSCDVAGIRNCPELTPEQADLIVCNPPYRAPGTGRRPPDSGRDVARFEAVAPISAFVKAAAYLVKNRRRVCFIGLPERLPELFADMASVKLEPKRMRLVHSRIEETAKLALVEAVKNGSPSLVIEPPLVLYKGQGDQTTLTQDALGYCPFLECNS